MTLRTAACGTAFGILIWWTPASLGARQTVALNVSPAVAFAPANLVVRAIIQHDPANRAVEIVAESDTFYRSSEIQLDGDHAARTNLFEFKGVPQGRYEVSARVLDASGDVRAVAHQEVDVISSGADRRP